MPPESPLRAARGERPGNRRIHGQTVGVKVLVIEDEVALAEAVQRGLEAEGFEVEVSHDGLEGLGRARTGFFDLIVLDIMLPGMNGYRVCRTLRSEEVWTPILMLTAKDGEYDEAEALDTGADDFLSKPFSFVVLVARLRALARRRSDSNLQPLEVGDLVLDPVARAVRRGETPISLSPREFAVLDVLMRRPQRGRGLRRLPAPQGRPAFRPIRHRDHPRRGVPAGGTACGASLIRFASA